MLYCQCNLATCMISINLEAGPAHSREPITSQWRHNGRDNVSNHQPHDCLLKGLFRRRSKKTWKLRVTGLCAGNSPGTGEFPAHKWPVTRKMFPFDDVIMIWVIFFLRPDPHLQLIKNINSPQYTCFMLMNYWAVRMREQPYICHLEELVDQSYDITAVYSCLVDAVASRPNEIGRNAIVRS